MTTRLEKNVSRFDILKSIAEIIAIIVGGLWVLFTFGLKDTPSLSRLSNITPELSVNRVCNKMHLSFFVTIKNNGKSNFEVVEPVTIKVWLIPIKSLTKSSYFDWERYMKNPANMSTTDIEYEGNYAPDESVKISHDFFVNDSYNDTAKYTVLAAAFTKYKSYSFGVFSKTEPDHAYDVKIRYSELDPGS